MAVCQFSGNSDMYGLGIRLGYYLQWFGAIFASWIAPSEVNSLRFSIDLFVAATFLALVILTANDADSLEPVEIYIVLLLMFGAYLALVPIYLLRMVTRCDPYWDPSRWPLVRRSELAATLSFGLLVGLLVFQYWFWFSRVPSLNGRECQEYGFLFGKVRLNSSVSVAINALLYIALGVVCLWILYLNILHAYGIPGPSEKRRKRAISRRCKYAHIRLLQNMDGWFRLTTACLVVTATELSIAYNNISGVNTLNSAGQTIPFIIGLGLVLRILYVAIFVRASDDSGSDSEYEHRSSGGGRGPGPLPDFQLPNMHGRAPGPIPDHHMPQPVMFVPPDDGSHMRRSQHPPPVPPPVHISAGSR